MGIIVDGMENYRYEVVKGDTGEIVATEMTGMIGMRRLKKTQAECVSSDIAAHQLKSAKITVVEHKNRCYKDLIISKRVENFARMTSPPGSNPVGIWAGGARVQGGEESLQEDPQ
ncbi:hypothetical protein ACLOJK_021537 [Asimina triloba]